MMMINIQEAKVRLPMLIAEMKPDDEIVIARYGKPVAKLIPIKSAHLPPRKPGSARGKFKVPKEFFEPLPDDILDAFEQ